MEFNKSTSYRIYTENKNQQIILDMVSTYFDCFSVICQRGYWDTEEEDSICIEILLCDTSNPAVRFDVEGKIADICKNINTTNSQQCCMVTRTEVESVFNYDRVH